MVTNLGHSLGGDVEARATQEHVELLPGLPAKLLDEQEALDLRTAVGRQEVLRRPDGRSPSYVTVVNSSQ